MAAHISSNVGSRSASESKSVFLGERVPALQGVHTRLLKATVLAKLNTLRKLGSMVLETCLGNAESKVRKVVDSWILRLSVVLSLAILLELGFDLVLGTTGLRPNSNIRRNSFRQDSEMRQDVLGNLLQKRHAWLSFNTSLLDFYGRDSKAHRLDQRVTGA
ncbi:hypothetical protein HG530_012694 [Fusarium avenaceum]|nr:hypothetical protein HG530_012694 [Fusarium avenaceum]